MQRFLSKLTAIQGGSLLRVLTVERLNAIQDAIKALARGENISTGAALRKGAGEVGVRLDVRPGRAGPGGGGGSAAGPCYFGEIITVEGDGSDSSADAKTVIRGGRIEAGKKIWHVPDYEIVLGTPGEWLVWVRIPITANMDPDGNVVIAGIAESEAPVWEKAAFDSDASAAVAYGEKKIPEIFPSADKGSGIAILPSGILRVAGGAASIAETACGHGIVTHCPGSLTVTRGDVGFGSSE